MTDRSSNKTGKIVSIQILRAIACLLVLQVHMLPDIPLVHIPFQGSIGVDIFFVISGFIIANSVKKLPAYRPATYFAINRFSRVVPLYFSLSILCLALNEAYGNHIEARRILHTFLFLPYKPISEVGDPIMVVGWTLNHEMFFYFFVAISLLFTRNIDKIAIAFAVTLVVTKLLPIKSYTLNFISSNINYLFLTGILISIYEDKVIPLFRQKGWLLLAGALILSAGFSGTQGTLQPIHKTLIMPADFYLREYIYIYNHPLYITRFFAYGIPAILLFLSVVANSQLFNRFKGTYIEKIGNASYSMYLVHWFFVLTIFEFAIPYVWRAVLAAIAIVFSVWFLRIENYLGSWTKTKLSALFLRNDTD